MCAGGGGGYDHHEHVFGLGLEAAIGMRMLGSNWSTYSRFVPVNSSISTDRSNVSVRSASWIPSAKQLRNKKCFRIHTLTKKNCRILYGVSTKREIVRVDKPGNQKVEQ